MFNAETTMRVRYGETDQMGYLYYGHYAQYYEVGRAEAFRNLGYSYRKMEEQGIILVVSELQSRYLRPARYDDLVTVKTMVRELPRGAKLRFYYEIYNASGELLNTGMTTLVMLDARDRDKREIPEEILELLRPYFQPPEA